MATAASRPALVIDNGTGYTKMGFSGNAEPSYIIPSCIGVNDTVTAAGRRGSALEDLDYAIGQEALSAASSTTVSWPIRHGTVENWDHMERYWAQCMFKCAAARRAREAR